MAMAYFKHVKLEYLFNNSPSHIYDYAADYIYDKISNTNYYTILYNIIMNNGYG